MYFISFPDGPWPFRLVSKDSGGENGIKTPLCTKGSTELIMGRIENRILWHTEIVFFICNETMDWYFPHSPQKSKNACS